MMDIDKLSKLTDKVISVADENEDHYVVLKALQESLKECDGTEDLDALFVLVDEKIKLTRARELKIARTKNLKIIDDLTRSFHRRILSICLIAFIIGILMAIFM